MTFHKNFFSLLPDYIKMLQFRNIGKECFGESQIFIASMSETNDVTKHEMR
jgi:hypothetical protein